MSVPLHASSHPQPVLLPSLADSRILSRDECTALGTRVFAMAKGGGRTSLNVRSEWNGTLRWARNLVTGGGDSQENQLSVSRAIRGAGENGSIFVLTNALDDTQLESAMRRAEQMVLLYTQDPDEYPVAYKRPAQEIHPHAKPAIWSDRTYTLDAVARAKVAEPVIARAVEGGLMSAGYLSVSAFGAAVLTTNGLSRYYPYTAAQYSLTVRDPKQGGSGWAGVNFSDWSRIDTAALAQTAIEKCKRSRNPVAAEPGRYVAILEPQAVCDLFAPIMNDAMDRAMAEQGMGPFAGKGGMSKIGERVVDDRITISADPMDPDLGFVPFDWGGEPYLNTVWIKDGVLKALSYSRMYGLQKLGIDWALPNSRAFHMSGGTATVDEMIASTTRGILVTRLSAVTIIDSNSMQLTGTTRDGLWLIEHGKISKPIKNFRFVESPLFVLNKIEMLGVPQRVFRTNAFNGYERWSDAPAVCPPLKVRDFNCAGLTDAV